MAKKRKAAKKKAAPKKRKAAKKRQLLRREKLLEKEDNFLSFKYLKHQKRVIITRFFYDRS